ncbi:MAG: DNA primase [Thermodesulfobacteriota bacterium]
MIPQEKIEEIRLRVSIVDIISEHIMLKKRGANHIGLCPFHSEKTPSFTVSEEKKIFYCFGCNAKGNVFAFLMKHENLSFPEAVMVLARRTGVHIPKEKKGYSNDGHREKMFEANRVAADYFQIQLLGRGGKEAREYLKRRGLDERTTKDFKLGYAPSLWDGLINFFSSKEIPLDVASEVGLIIKKEGGYYDRFRERIIFPILDTGGRVIAFGGRSLSGREPKYLNSPDSPLFRKGETLYGLFQARQDIARKGFVLIVEGYFDLIALHRNGFKNCTATMGTALTSGHLKKLKGCAKEVYTLFDADEAGRKAAIRGLNLFLDENIPSKAVFIPTGMDPDEFIAKEGPGSMDKTIAQAEPLMEFFLKVLKQRFDIKTAAGKVAYMEEVIPYLRKISNITEKGHYAEMASSALGIGVDIVYTAIKETGGKAAGHHKAYESVGMKDFTRAEEKILKVLILHPELYNNMVDVAIDRFRNAVLKDAAKYVMGLIKEEAGKIDVSSFVDAGLNEDVKNCLIRTAVEENDEIKDAPEKILKDCCKKVIASGKLREDTVKLIRQLEEAGRLKEASLVRSGAESRLVKK